MEFSEKRHSTTFGVRRSEKWSVWLFFVEREDTCKL